MEQEPSSTRETRAGQFRTLPAPICFTKEIIPLKEMNWKSILANEPYKYRSLSAAISKMVMRLLRHSDQDERDIDGAVRWNNVSPKLLRAFGHQEHEIFPQKIKFKHSHEGSDETRFEYGESSRNSLVFLRAIQGHTGVQLMAPDLMGHVAIPCIWKEFVFHRGWSLSLSSILEIGLIFLMIRKHRGKTHFLLHTS